MAVRTALLTIPLALIAAICVTTQYNLNAFGGVVVYSALGQAMFVSLLGAQIAAASFMRG